MELVLDDKVHQKCLTKEDKAQIEKLYELRLLSMNFLKLQSLDNLPELKHLLRVSIKSSNLYNIF